MSTTDEQTETATQAKPKAAKPQKPKVTQMKLGALEAHVAETLIEKGVQYQAIDVKTVARIGDPVVKRGALAGYTWERYGQGRWVSPGCLKRVRGLLGEPAPITRTNPVEAPAEAVSAEATA
jgi:hypothetical protein